VISLKEMTSTERLASARDDPKRSDSVMGSKGREEGSRALAGGLFLSFLPKRPVHSRSVSKGPSVEKRCREKRRKISDLSTGGRGAGRGGQRESEVKTEELTGSFVLLHKLVGCG